MIHKVRIENFKSIADLTLNLRRLTVLIGSNGSGKSNILEALSFASAASQNKLDNEFLSSRGIRVTESRFMYSAFQNLPLPRKFNHNTSQEGNGANIEQKTDPARTIRISSEGDNSRNYDCELFADESGSFPKWEQLLDVNQPISKFMTRVREEFFNEIESSPEIADKFATAFRSYFYGTFSDFLIYSPENSALRTFQSEGQILPLGIRGEGLFAHLKGLNATHKDRLEIIREKLKLIDWFESFSIPGDLSPGERTIKIQDRFIKEGDLIDQRSANEGFLFLLFYLTLFTSPETPAFFAIDNIDSSLNPKLCIALLRQITALAKEFDKQVILTTHNPAVLDGLDLHDEEQQLLVVDRNKDGHTRVQRVEPPKPSAGELPVSLSEAFMRGYIGGLPKNF